ncbi:MAG: MFS transporter [Thermoplasmata archaeon]|uniref:MFS transporter n=1 Tax=Candidatus Sysuiplasma superficiale TaxID=2823368 RepID=A0A8J8CHT6_9ARCH|nr:MFS transporter [Candidatus Sysuiplasma superficiale]MBX8644273.1 MFS transporter [Candidatus Sysuiplasma superficiale]
MSGGQSPFASLDEQGIRKYHIRTLIVSGMGFFTDAYDLFVIGAILPIIGIYFDISDKSLAYALISSSALFGAIIGPLIFGPIADRYGRKIIYSFDLLILVAAAIGSATATSASQLILWRFVLGIGIGADYPVSATIMSEFSNRKDRGKLVASVFAMQGFGQLTGALVTLLTLFLHFQLSLSWRIPLAMGAVPALAVLYMRNRISETPRYAAYSGMSNGSPSSSHNIPMDREEGSRGYGIRIPKRDIISMYIPLILGTSLCWFALDVSFYGTGIFANTIIHDVGAISIIHSTEITAAIFLFSAFPGYWAAVYLIDNIGRKKLQLLGFIFMAVAYSSIVLIPFIVSDVTALFVVFGSTFFFINMGPNTTTFVIPVEVFPTQIRTTGHGIAAATGKAGAAMSAFLFPFMLKYIHLSGIFSWLAVVSILGLALTVLFIPEGQDRRLEDISGEERLLKTYSEFSDLISQLTEKIVLASEETNSFVNEWGNTGEIARKIKSIEHDCDEIVHRIFVRLNTKFLAPINRMEIVSLAQALDDIMDYIEATVARFEMYNISASDEYIREFMKTILSCTKEVAVGIANINDIYSKRFDRIERSCIEINKYENESDSTLRRALQTLFRGSDAIHIIKLKEIYDNLETVTDKCEDVADILRDLIVKYRGL